MGSHHSSNVYFEEWRIPVNRGSFHGTNLGKHRQTANHVRSDDIDQRRKRPAHPEFSLASAELARWGVLHPCYTNTSAL